MRALLLAVAAGALLAATPVSAAGIPPNRLADVSSDLVDQVALRVYIHEGRRYCFYFNGWHGPGWYRCGFAFRRGLGWGGTYGWNDWSYGPYERRFGRTHRGSVGFDVRSGDRSRTTIRSRSSTTTGVAPSGSSEFRSRSTTGSSVERSGRTAEILKGGVDQVDRVVCFAGLLGRTPGADPCIQFLAVLRCDCRTLGREPLDILMGTETLLPVEACKRAALLQIFGLCRRSGSVRGGLEWTRGQPSLRFSVRGIGV